MAGQALVENKWKDSQVLSLEYRGLRSFGRQDGGYERVVWLPKEIKNTLSDYIPADLIDKIPTEERC